MVLSLIDLGVFVSGSGKCGGQSFQCVFSCVANEISLGQKLVPFQHQGGPSLHGVHDKRCDEMSVGDQPGGYDKVIHSSYLGEVYATHSGACELKVFFMLFCNCRVAFCLNQFKDTPNVRVFLPCFR